MKQEGKLTEHGDYTYAYDDSYRLTAADKPVQSDEAYTYDAVGNWVSALETTDTWNYNDNIELGVMLVSG